MRNVRFNNNLQEFTQKASYIYCLQTGGKLSQADSYKQIKSRGLTTLVSNISRSVGHPKEYNRAHSVMNLLAKIFTAIADMFDPFIHLEKTATDKDYLLVKNGDQIMLLTGTGKIVTASNTISKNSATDKLLPISSQCVANQT